MSQFSTSSYDLLAGGSFRGRRRSRSRSRSRSTGRVVAPLRPRYQLARNWYVPNNKPSKGTVHKFTRCTVTNQSFNQTNDPAFTNYWYINNRVDAMIAYGGTTPAVYGNQISIYFDLISVHMDLYSNGGIIQKQTVYGIPSAAEFVALYEEFRIDYVEIDCFASQENAYRSGTGDVSSYSPVIYYIKDYNDPDSTSLTQMMQQEDLGTWQPGIGVNGTYHRKIRVKPKANFTVANAAQVGAGTAKMPGLSWMTTEDSQTIPHYGLKMSAANFFPQGATQNTPSMYLAFQFTYHLSFRNVK